MEGIRLGVLSGGDGQTCLGRRPTDERKHRIQTGQWLAGPVDGDRAEYTVLDRIPLRGSGGIVANGDFQPGLIGELLEGAFPQAWTTTIAAAGVGFDQETLAFWKTVSSRRLPPRADGGHREFASITRCADRDSRRVVRQVVHAIRHRLADRVVREVVSVHFVRGSAIGAAHVLELADEFLFLRIHAENRIARRKKCLTLFSQILELLIAIRMRRSRESFDVHTQREAQFRQQSPHGFRRVPQPSAKFAQAQSHELASRDRRTTRHRFDQLDQSLFELRLFFSTTGRPAPGNRVRPTGRPAKSSANS